MEDSIGQQDAEVHKELIKFIVEQLHLVQLPKQGRHYSSELICLSFLWLMTVGQSMYKKLKKLFILPSVRRLQQLAQGTSIEDSMFNSQYFEKRVSNFTSQQRLVILLIDEVYTAQRMEYSNGKFYWSHRRWSSV